MRPVLAFAASCALVLPAASASADPSAAPFASAPGSCSGGHAEATGAATSQSHDAVLIRFVATSGSGGWRSVQPAGPTRRLGTHDVPTYYSYATGPAGWRTLPALAANTAPSIDVLCNSPTTFTVEWYDIPSPPVSFSGAGDAEVALRVAGPNAFASDIKFLGDIQSLSLGRRVVLHGRTAVVGEYVLTAPGEAVFGSARGSSGVDQVKVSGGSTPWTVTFDQAAPAISAVAFSQPWLRPGRNGEATYTCIRPTSLTARVLDSSGRAVRSIVTNAQIASTALSGPLIWDGRDSSGALVTDGTYTLHVDSSEPATVGSGSAPSSAEDQISVDGTPPVVTLRRKSSLSRRTHLQFLTSDAGSGLESAELHVDGKVVMRVVTAGLTSYRPAGRWRAGRHRVTVVAVDKVGNTRTVHRVYRAGRARRQ